MNGYTALIIAVQRKSYKVAKFLIPLENKLVDSNDWTALMWAADMNNLEMISLLLPFEARMQDNLGYTAAIWAARNGKKCSQVLCEYEGDIKDKEGRDASWHAS